ncbi:flagellar assembly peptidoglycan hydrolase FlgJ [Luteimonas sp. 22616]|uniref:flagellar assembly peptidoglycan hydrolase FlgJ n=1 Tax=Luteimonas sp. 22616 TaxID=3453951 RepID=UPI003F832FC6
MRLPAANPIALAPTSTTPHAGIEKAARELETQFAQMLIKSMRSTAMGDSMFGGNNTYREMYDQQLARELGKGGGLGLAPMIVRQLERGSNGAAAATGATPPGALPLRMPGTSATATPMPLAAPFGALPLAPSSSGVSMPAFDVPATSMSETQAAVECADIPLDCSSPEAFVQSIWPQAQKTAAELGVPARALVAQAALETGWGRRLAGREGVSSQNLFGIKAGSRWNGERMNSATHEFVDGVRRSERADFRAYGSTAESFVDYARLLDNPRYAAARNAGNDTHRFASALQQAGYATDPNYAAKITAIANGATLNRALAAMPAASPASGAVYASNAIAMARE